MKNYAIENEMLKHPQKMLISIFKLEKGTVITPLFNFYMQVSLQCTYVAKLIAAMTTSQTSSNSVKKVGTNEF